jgi:hypothetical protein
MNVGYSTVLSRLSWAKKAAPTSLSPNFWEFQFIDPIMKDDFKGNRETLTLR